MEKCSTRDCTSSVTSTDVITGSGATPWVAATDIQVAPNGFGFFTYHDGETGDVHRGNVYRFKLPKDLTANNTLVLRAEIRSPAGANSYGRVLCLTEPGPPAGGPGR